MTSNSLSRYDIKDIDSVSSVSFKDFLPHSVQKSAERKPVDLCNQSYYTNSISIMPQNNHKHAITGRSFFSSKHTIVKPQKTLITDSMTKKKSIESFN